MENKLLAKNKKVNCAFSLLLLGLLLLRLPFLILLEYHKISIPADIGTYIYYDGTYLFTALLILLKRNSLSDYHFSFCALILFMIAPVAGLIGEYSEINCVQTGTVQPDLWLRIAISVCLFITLLILHPKIPKRRFKESALWFLIAVAVGICAGVMTGKILSLQSDARISIHPSIALTASAFFVQLGNAASSEEPLFRGLLWGFLKKLHWHDWWILLFQAALFWLGHIYYLGVFNYSFWIVVPFSALILGFVAWRSKSIGTSMVVHGLINSLGDVVAHFTW